MYDQDQLFRLRKRLLHYGRDKLHQDGYTYFYFRISFVEFLFWNFVCVAYLCEGWIIIIIEYINSNHDCRNKCMVSTKKRRAACSSFSFIMLIIISHYTIQPFANIVTNYICYDSGYDCRNNLHDFTSSHAMRVDDNTLTILLYLIS